MYCLLNLFSILYNLYAEVIKIPHVTNEKKAELNVLEISDKLKNANTTHTTVNIFIIDILVLIFIITLHTTDSCFFTTMIQQLMVVVNIVFLDNTTIGCLQMNFYDV